MRIAFLLVEKATARKCLWKLLEVKLPTAALAPSTIGDPRVGVVLKNGRSLRVRPGFDRELVRALAAVLEIAA